MKELIYQVGDLLYCYPQHVPAYTRKRWYGQQVKVKAYGRAVYDYVIQMPDDPTDTALANEFELNREKRGESPASTTDQ